MTKILCLCSKNKLRSPTAEILNDIQPRTQRSRTFVKIEALSKNHSDQLFMFEIQNRLWFESLIEPRDSEFYTKQGFDRHINEEINKANSGTTFSGVLVKSNRIVARANLREIADNSASVGYRVSKEYTSQGCASFCLSSLIKIARRDFPVDFLEAKVLDNNPASKHILLKHGFKAIETIPSAVILNGRSLDCIKLKLNDLPDVIPNCQSKNPKP